MPDGENDFDWLQSFFPGWKEEDQAQGNRNNGGPDQNHQNHQLNPHPAFADAAHVAQAAHAAYVRYHHSQSPQVRTAQMSQPGQPPAQYSQGMDQTLFRSQLHRHSQYEQRQPQRQPQQPQQQTQQQTLRLPQPQPYNQAQHRAEHQARQQEQRREHEDRQQAEQKARQQAEQQRREEEARQKVEQARQEAEQHARQQAEQRARYQAEQQRRKNEARQNAEQQVRQQSQTYEPYGTQHQPLRPPSQDHRDQLQQYYREAQHQRQTQAQPGSRPQQNPTQPPPQQYQYRDAPHQQQYVRSSDISPSASYYQPNSSRSYTSLAPVRDPVHVQKSASGPTPVQSPRTASQSPVETHSGLRTGEFLQRTPTSPKSHPSGQQGPSLVPPPTKIPTPAPSAQRNSTPMNTQQNVPETRPNTPPLAPGQSQTSSKQLEGPRRGSFLEDTAIFSTTSPQKDPYTSSSRSTLGPRATTSKTSTAVATAPAPDKPTKRPSVSHSHPSPKQVTSTTGPASSSSSTSAPMSAPAQPRTSGSPPVRNSTPAAAATDRSSTGTSTSSVSARSPPGPPVNYAIPPALRVYATPQMHRAYTPPQPVNDSAPQPSAQIARSTSAPSVPPVPSKSTAPAVPPPPKASVPTQATAQMARSAPATSAPPDNFTPFTPASTAPTTSTSSAPVTTRPIAAPSTSGNGRNSPLPPQARLAGTGQLVDRRTMHSHPGPPSNGRPGQYQPAPSGLPTLQNIAPTTAPGLAPAPPPAWRPPSNTAYPASGSVPRPVNRSNPAPGQFAVGPRAPSSQTREPTGVYRPGKMNTPPNLARTVARPAGQNTPGSLQARPASTQPPAAKMRKLDDSSRHAVTPPSKTLDDVARYARQSPSRKHITYRSDIVEPVKISDIMVKAAYDPATIARDILIVADKHPAEKGLNHHLNTIRQNFQAVEYSSDLATFRWDLVDPWVQYPPGLEEAMARAQQISTTSVPGLEPNARALNLPSKAPNLPLHSPGLPHVAARDVPTAPLPRPVESRFDYRSNISAVATSSSQIPSSSLVSLGPTVPALLNSGVINSGKFGPDVTTTGATNTNVTPSYQAHPSTLTSTASPVSTPKSTQKAIPTPPSAVNLNAFGALPFKAPSHYSPLRPTAQPLPYSLPSLPPSSSPQKVHSSVSVVSPPSVSSSVPAPLPQSSPQRSVELPPQSPRSKVPRQSPLPKGLPEPQVVIPISPGVMAPPKKKPTRPPQRDVQVEVAIDNRPAPEYQVFQCKWTGCKAELHNLQAMQSHVVGVHIPHHLVCGWADCGDEKLRPASEMWEHVQANHINPLAWQLGDGPSVSIPAAGGYESPEMSSQDRNDTMTLPADRDSVKIFSRIHGTQTGKQKAQLMEDGGRQWKEGAGPDTDVSDRALSTPPRLLASSHTETAYTMSNVQVVI
ncbi:uncharacterized protein N7496_007552 [Penicillium cataractarum]|uniref:C2H2-type domain-containing protein n=1 Tax=Penicillium cataractarum TaxID=2100454 RepID=A0A9W9S4Z0_9EURO|nr:uncharacterized protein N7496_007552 [Penicillium cataractarum]KAJ5371460.1 hypothetical protein N7496_007552 [Penicillium cataractarum]